MKNYINKNQNNASAITLIALVITIVVLIILAAVAINLSLGNNGIFNRAKTSKELYQNAEEYEQAEVSKTTNSIDYYTLSTRNESSEINYSLNEFKTKDTLNGKPIYTKGYILSLTSSTDETFETGVANIAILWVDIQNTFWLDHTSSLENYSGYALIPQYYMNNADYMRTGIINKKMRVCHPSSWNGTYVYMTIRYTKTTD